MLQPHERIEYAISIRIRNSGAIVIDRYECLLCITGCFDHDFAGGESDCVLHEISKAAFQFDHVSANDHHSQCQFFTDSE